ncbi:IQ domain-containing protein IQM2-like [Tripterygium wilfordii]|uniref:IQ domain-containing protein IQM2-like n=1 Tax=Tripterygium wilfordii TaxID=458696 RepID=UPI0018F83D03|nr:IQ domain-containing protein IQM2-like [Tripterygium wilfordii]
MSGGGGRVVGGSMENPSNRQHEAAIIRLQRAYKSFRTIRKLADCAVLVGEKWWESPKVAKGLSTKGYKARNMVSLHWLEVIDPRHRHGHNLHFYYEKWLQCHSKEHFFSWLDLGDGKKINLDECPRLILQQRRVNYLGPMERKLYEVNIKDGKFLYKQTGELLHTSKDAKWIYVLSPSEMLYAGKKRKGTFHHSSFLAGGATIAAGGLVVENGILKEVSRQSGHYRPTEENLGDFISFLKENNVDLTYVQTNTIDYENLRDSRFHMHELGRLPKHGLAGGAVS